MMLGWPVLWWNDWRRTSGTLKWGKKDAANSDEQWKTVSLVPKPGNVGVGILRRNTPEYAAGIAGRLHQRAGHICGMLLAPSAFLFIAGCLLPASSRMVDLSPEY
jgi:hypothetical protein